MIMNSLSLTLNSQKCDLVEKLSKISELDLSKKELTNLLNPMLYVGRSEEQVISYIGKIRTLISGEISHDSIEL